MINFKESIYKNNHFHIYEDTLPKTLIKIVAIVSLISTVSNILLDMFAPINFSGFFMSLWGFYCLKTDNCTKHFSIFTFATCFLYSPSVYIVADGFKGSNALFTIMLVFMLMTIFEYKTGKFLTYLLGLEYICLSFLQYFKPELFLSYETDLDRLIAMLISMICCALMVMNLSTSYVKTLKDSKELSIKFQELSIKDPLTNTYNRRFLIDKLAIDLPKALESNNDLSLLIMDIDYFKKVNDNYGHVIGDEILSSVAKCLKDNIDENQIVVRYGGEEFVVLLPNISIDNAEVIANNLRIKVSELKNTHNITTTISVGCSSIEKNDTMENLCSRADTNLYKAKENGRNCVVGKL